MLLENQLEMGKKCSNYNEPLTLLSCWHYSKQSKATSSSNVQECIIVITITTIIIVIVVFIMWQFLMQSNIMDASGLLWCRKRCTVTSKGPASDE